MFLVSYHYIEVATNVCMPGNSSGVKMYKFYSLERGSRIINGSPRVAVRVAMKFPIDFKSAFF